MKVSKNEVFGRMVRTIITECFNDPICNTFSYYNPNANTLTVHSVVSLGALTNGSTKEDAVAYTKRHLVSILNYFTRDCPSVNNPRIKEYTLPNDTKQFFAKDSYGAVLTIEFV